MLLSGKNSYRNSFSFDCQLLRYLCQIVYATPPTHTPQSTNQVVNNLTVKSEQDIVCRRASKDGAFVSKRRWRGTVLYSTSNSWQVTGLHGSTTPYTNDDDEGC